MFPHLVLSVAFRLLFISLNSFQVGRSVPSFCTTYSIASNHALSYIVCFRDIEECYVCFFHVLPEVLDCLFDSEYVVHCCF